jgi:hypothetical protein
MTPFSNSSGQALTRSLGKDEVFKRLLCSKAISGQGIMEFLRSEM